jgi:hypothetical protein
MVVLAASAVGLVTAPGGGAKPTAPAGVREWLGDWKTNFGEIWFSSLTYTDTVWNRSSGAEVSSCQAYRDCQYGWVLRGLWHWPGHDWVPLKAKFAPNAQPKDYNSMEPCWLGPYSLEVPGNSGNACYAMLLFKYGEEERGGFWKACFLEENCKDHHYLHGQKVAEHNGESGLWKVGFSFLQRGKPDGHNVITTQTGGAGTMIFPENPSGVGHGQATEGSLVFHVDNLGAAPEPQYTITLLRGKVTYERDRGELLQTILRMTGIVSSSNDGRCHVGAQVRVELDERHRAGHPSVIALEGSQFPPFCAVNETWTSTDKSRVSVHVSRPQSVP